MNDKKIEELITGSRPIYLELGSGARAGTDGWVTCDLNDTCDIKHDLASGIPFPDNSVNKIYSSHFLEHLTFEECQILLDE